LQDSHYKNDSATLACAARPNSKILYLISSIYRVRKIMKKYQCIICAYIYDEALGNPDDGIAPGTKWEDVPADWICPDCGVSKSDFEMMEI
jgi:rubredoxin